MKKPKKQTRYMPNVTSSLDIVMANLIMVSKRVKKGHNRTFRFVASPKDFAKLKARNPSLKKIIIRSPSDLRFLDVQTSEFYVVRKKRHNNTIPIERTKIPFSTEFKNTRSGGVHLERTPSIFWKAPYIPKVMIDEGRIS